MRYLITALLTAVLAPALLADEAAQANTDKFLAGLKEVDKSILGTTRYKLSYTGRRLGSMTLTLAESTYESGACYRVDSRFELALGDNTFKMTQCGYVSPDLKLLYQTQMMSESGKPDEHETYTLTPEGYVRTRSDNEKGLESHRYEAAPRMIEELAELVFILLLPHDAGKKYDAKRWSKLRGQYDVTYTVDGERKIGELTGILLRENYLDIDEDDKGKRTSADVENTYLVSPAHKMLRMTSSKEPFTIEFDDGRYTKDEVKQMATALDPVLAFWMAARDKDVDFLKLAINENRYVEEMLERREKDEDLSGWEREFIKKEVRDNLCESMLEKMDLADHLKLMVDGITAAWFDVRMEGDNKAKVGFSESFAKDTGDKSIIWWYVEKNAETGTWEMVYMEVEEDEF